MLIAIQKYTHFKKFLEPNLHLLNPTPHIYRARSSSRVPRTLLTINHRLLHKSATVLSRRGIAIHSNCLSLPNRTLTDNRSRPQGLAYLFLKLV